MVKKKSLNLSIPTDLLEEFEQVCSHYGHGKQKGMVLSAAILMFLRSDPMQQGACLEQVATAEITHGVEQMIERARRHQLEQIQHREADSPRKLQMPPQPGSTPRKAAKSAGPTHHVLRKPPEDPERR